MNNNIGELCVERIKSIFDYLNFNIPSDEELNFCTRASTFYCTYSWDSKVIERICFGILNNDVSTVPVEIHPYVAEYTDKAKFLTEYESYIYSMTYSRQGSYIKIENDYSGTMIRFMKQNS